MWISSAACETMKWCGNNDRAAVYHSINTALLTLTLVQHALTSHLQYTLHPEKITHTPATLWSFFCMWEHANYQISSIKGAIKSHLAIVFNRICPKCDLIISAALWEYLWLKWFFQLNRCGINPDILTKRAEF